jgi:hypothetical protein
MKKILFMLVAAFVCTTISAQLVTSTTYRSEKPKTLWYVKGGLTMNKFTGDGVEVDGKAGYNIGIAFDRPIGGSGIFWGMGLQLASKGYKIDEEGYETKLKANKLEIPLNIGYKYNVNDDIAVDARIGGFVNYDVFGKMTSSYEGEEESIDLGDLEGYDRFGAGIQFGVGVWYQRINFNITYQKGLVSQIADTAKESNWMLSVGYAF